MINLQLSTKGSDVRYVFTEETFLVCIMKILISYYHDTFFFDNVAHRLERKKINAVRRRFDQMTGEGPQSLIKALCKAPDATDTRAGVATAPVESHRGIRTTSDRDDKDTLYIDK